MPILKATRHFSRHQTATVYIPMSPVSRNSSLSVSQSTTHAWSKIPLFSPTYSLSAFDAYCISCIFVRFRPFTSPKAITKPHSSAAGEDSPPSASTTHHAAYTIFQVVILLQCPDGTAQIVSPVILLFPPQPFSR